MAAVKPKDRVNRFVASRRSEEDTLTGSLFGDDLPQAEGLPKPPKEKKRAGPEPAAKAGPAPEAPGSRKSVQDFEHEESVEGLRKKYEATSQGIPGFEDSIFLPNGDEVDGVWRLVDAFSVTPSHDPFTFHQSKGFPTLEGGGSVNTRDYGHESDSMLNVVTVAGDFDGRALGFDSAVVVTKDGIVISGNNRTMSSQLAARKGTDKKYVQALLKRCRSFGFTPEQVSAFEHPRVVFEIDSNDYSPEHFDRYNDNDKKEQTEEARIVKFSKVVKPAVLRELADVYRRYQFDFGNVYANPGIVQEVMGIFVKGGVLSQIAVSKYFDGNKISASGKEFIREYTLGAVLNEPVVRALYGEGMGNLKETVINVAPRLLENWSMGSYSVREELNKAIEFAVAYTRDLMSGEWVVPKLDKEKAQGMDAGQKLAYNLEFFRQWAQQGDLFDAKDPVVLKLAGSLVYSAPLFKSYLDKINDATAKAADLEREDEEFGGAGMFGDMSPDRHGLLERAVASWDRQANIKRGILSSVLLGGGVMDLVVSGVDGTKARIMKWTSASGQNQQAWRKAVAMFRENFGRGPESERDAKLLLKTAKGFSQGQMISPAQFTQMAQEEVAGQPQGGGNTAKPSGAQPQGGRKPRAKTVPTNDPSKLFGAIKNLYDSGQVSKDQLTRAFQTVLNSIAASFQRRRVESALARVSPELRRQWNAVQAFSSRLRSNGVKAKSDIVESLQSAFGWMTPELASEAYQSFMAVSGLRQESACRFQPLTSAQRRSVVSEALVGSRVVYWPFPLSSGAPAFLVTGRRRLAGQTGKVVSVRSEVYNVEMPGEELVSAAGDELEFIESARPVSNDSMRETVREFLSNVPSLTKVPDSQMGIAKERLEPSHVVYMYTETIANGRPYTVEFHMVPGELDADVYVVRDYDNHPLEEAGFTIEDLTDWNLSEADHVDALLAKEMARTGLKDSPVEGEEDEDDFVPGLDGKQYTFGDWFDNMDDVTAGLRRPSLVDLAICSGVYRALTSGGRPVRSSSSDDWYRIAQLAEELGAEIQETRNALARIWGWPEGGAPQPPVVEGEGERANIPSGVQAFLNRTMDYANRLVNQPLSVIDDVVALPAKAADAVRDGIKKNR
jgi:hypothetical protein